MKNNLKILGIAFLIIISTYFIASATIHAIFNFY